jgi:hypothetical protein
MPFWSSSTNNAPVAVVPAENPKKSLTRSEEILDNYNNIFKNLKLQCYTNEKDLKINNAEIVIKLQDLAENINKDT